MYYLILLISCRVSCCLWFLHLLPWFVYRHSVSVFIDLNESCRQLWQTIDWVPLYVPMPSWTHDCVCKWICYIFFAMWIFLLSMLRHEPTQWLNSCLFDSTAVSCAIESFLFVDLHSKSTRGVLSHFIATRWSMESFTSIAPTYLRWPPLIVHYIATSMRS